MSAETTDPDVTALLEEARQADRRARDTVQAVAQRVVDVEGVWRRVSLAAAQTRLGAAERQVEAERDALRSASRALLDAVTDTYHVPDAEADASSAWRRLGLAHQDLERLLVVVDDRN